MSPTLSEAEEREFYAKEFEKFMEFRSGVDIDWSGPELHVASNQNNVKRRWKVLEKFCSRGDHILEIGCSSGFMLDEFKEQGLECWGVEPSGGFGTYLNQKGHRVFNQIEDLPIEFNETFDVVCHFFVLEHIRDTKLFIKQQLELLKPGGVIFCEVPSATDALTSFFKIPEFERFYWSIAHHYYFTPKSISFILKELSISNYELIPEQRYDFANHVTWLQEGRPGGQGGYSGILSDDFLSSYKEELIRIGAFDTFFLIIKK